jgi:hypothetical protein
MLRTRHQLRAAVCLMHVDACHPQVSVWMYERVPPWATAVSYEFLVPCHEQLNTHGHDFGRRNVLQFVSLCQPLYPSARFDVSVRLANSRINKILACPASSTERRGWSSCLRVLMADLNALTLYTFRDGLSFSSCMSERIQQR